MRQRNRDYIRGVRERDRMARVNAARGISILPSATPVDIDMDQSTGDMMRDERM